MTTLKTLRQKYQSFNPKKDVYTFPINGLSEKDRLVLIGNLYDVFDKIIPCINYDFNNNPFGYIECHLN